jgi:hypothetical protein
MVSRHLGTLGLARRVGKIASHGVLLVAARFL